MEKGKPVPSAEQKREEFFQSWLHPKLQFVSAEAEEAYQARVTRIQQAVLLRVPDRVPVCPSFGFFPVYYAGYTCEEAMYDYDKLLKARRKCTMDFQADTGAGVAVGVPGKALDALDYGLYRWPGHGIPPNTPFQYVEGEYMKVEDYDALIEDPSDFWLRTFLPRICKALAPLSRLKPLASFMEIAFSPGVLSSFGSTEVSTALQALVKAGQETANWLNITGRGGTAIMAEGFPAIAGSYTKAPFDTLGDTLRGNNGIMMDMYRRPDKVLEAVERLTPLMIKMGVSGAGASGNPMVMIPLHKGADGFMSEKQFLAFYWPTLKRVILGLIEEGLVPYLFAEGGYNTRLDIVKDLPRGKTMWMFDQTDMKKAKEALGNTACIMGNVPTSLLNVGTPDDVTAYCKDLIKHAGKDGGFILANGAVIDRARPENIHAMVQTAKKYGVYK